MSLNANSAFSSLKTYRFRTKRSFKAFDDGTRKKWVFVVAAQDLPRDLPLDANARVPNVIKNPTCREMRQTLLTRPDMFPILNSGIVCTATAVDVRQDGNEQWVDIAFDQEQLQGVVNGGHTYGTLLEVIHDHPIYAESLPLNAVLKKDKADENPELSELLDDDERLADRMAKARAAAIVQLEVVAPVPDSDLLHDIARARNLSQSVDQTALQNLAGKYELMKQVLRDASSPFGGGFVDRVVWKTNQEVPEGSPEIPVKTLIHLLALMNGRIYKPGLKVANEVYTRSGVVVREFGDAEGEDSAYYDKLTALLPTFIKLYDHIYSSLPETEPSFPWADGKPPPTDRKRRKTTFTTPLLGRTCTSKVSGAFVWPVFSAFRLLVEDDSHGGLRFKTDPISLFDEKKSELSATIRNAFESRGRLVQQVGKSTDAWIRLEAQLELELKIRERMKAA